MSNIDINSQLQIAYLYSHSKSSVYKKVNNKDIIDPRKTKWFGNIWGGKK